MDNGIDLLHKSNYLHDYTIDNDNNIFDNMVSFVSLIVV